MEKADLAALLAEADAERRNGQQATDNVNLKVHHLCRANSADTKYSDQNKFPEVQRDKIIFLAARAKAEFEENQRLAVSRSSPAVDAERRRKALLEQFGLARAEYERARAAPCPAGASAHRRPVSAPLLLARPRCPRHRYLAPVTPQSLRGGDLGRYSAPQKSGALPLLLACWEAPPRATLPTWDGPHTQDRAQR